MSDKLKYCVLWVEDKDEENFVQGFVMNAEIYGIELVKKSNWQEAEQTLKNHFDEFSAIILDANCKMTPDKLEEGQFIPKVLQKLLPLFEDRKKVIPWYILSAGTMANFSFVVDIAMDAHLPYEDEWGQMLYIKDVPDDDPNHWSKLLENIQQVAKDQTNNVILYRHRDVFKYLGENKLIAKFARTELRKMLSVLYFPNEGVQGFKFEGNPLRKVMEHIFRTALKYGLLPKECVERDDQINLLESNRYMSGLNTKHSNLRYGAAGPKYEGRGGDSIFPEYLGNITRGIIEFGSIDSHTNEAFPYTIDDKDLELSEDEKELFFGYVLQVCHVVKFFGDFVEKHPNEAENKSLIQAVEPATQRNPKDKQKKSEEKLAEKTRQEDAKPAPKPISAEELIGKNGRVLNSGKGMYVHADAKCKVVAELKPQLTIGKSVTIETVEPNTGKDAEEYPFIITKLSINE